MRRLTSVSFVLAGALLAVNCEIAKTSNPLSPVVAGPMAGVGVSYPGIISPPAGAKVRDRDQPLTLVVGNPVTNSPRPMTVQVEIALDGAFKTVVFSRQGVPVGGDGQTRIPVGDKLPAGRTYYWHTNASDGANESGWSDTASFEVLQPIILGVPTPVSPVSNATVTTQGPVLTATNGSASGPAGTIYYHFQVSESSTFNTLAVNGTSLQGGGTTTYVTALQWDKSYYWRVRMLADDNTTGSWSSIEAFKTPPQPVSAPSPSPLPPMSSAECAKLTDALSIIQCYRNLYPETMSQDQHVPFLKSVTKQFNAVGVSSEGAGPFGILRKVSGNNCGGYSCDVICAGQGGGQKQWDILVNEKYATWGGSIPPPIRIDTCEIQ